MTAALLDTEAYAVESPEGEIAEVEEVWLDPSDEPVALAVRTRDGAHALLLEEDVVAVDREHRWVVVDSRPELLELAPPRLDGSRHGHLSASWTTTGEIVRPEPPRRLAGLHAPVPHTDVGAKPLWKQVAVLYGSVAVIVCAVLGLVFLISWLAGGSPY
jgi:hypothetical protein